MLPNFILLYAIQFQEISLINIGFFPTLLVIYCMHKCNIHYIYKHK